MLGESRFQEHQNWDEPRPRGRLGVSSPSGHSRKASLAKLCRKDIPGLLIKVPCGQRDEVESSEDLGREAL